MYFTNICSTFRWIWTWNS